MKNFQKFLFVSLIVIFLDLLTKSIAAKVLSNQDISVIPGFFDLTLVWNRGAAFGVLGHAPEFVRKLILIFASGIAVVVAIIYSYKKRDQLHPVQLFSLALITGGAIGNLYDRIFLGAVRDFIDIHIKNYHWPAFNIADSSITIGIAMFVIYEIFFKSRS
ncbi:MAG: signal peptidase II [Aquificota bacterium]|nr:MAG: signal peptidase II [Aquificota bacterium]